MFFLDLDEFKGINDKYGHEAGDFLLTRLAHGLVDSLGESDTVARLSGDEFRIVVTEIHGRKDVELIAQKNLGLVSLSVPFREQTLAVSGSLGICIPKPGDLDRD